MEKVTFFSKNLRTWLFAHNTNQTELGVSLGLSGTAVNKWILENRPPKGFLMQGLCKHIGVDPVKVVEKDLTYQILQAANYTDTVVQDPPDVEYSVNSDIMKAKKHLLYINDALKKLVSENEKLLESIK